MYPERFFTALQQLYAVVDEASIQLNTIHKERLKCKKGCFGCCIDDLSVFEIEAENIKKNYPAFFEKEKPHAKGMCAMLDENGACRIYESRPFVCRTQGFPLRMLEEEDGELIELRDICELNEEGEVLTDMSEKKFFFTTPFENKLAEIQFKADVGNMKRVLLRDLFQTK